MASSSLVIVNKLHRKKVVGQPPTVLTTYQLSTNHLPTTKDPFMPWTVSCKTVDFMVRRTSALTTYGKMKYTENETNIFLSTDHLPTTYRPLTDHLLTTYRPLTDHFFMVQLVHNYPHLLFSGFQTSSIPHVSSPQLWNLALD